MTSAKIGITLFLLNAGDKKVGGFEKVRKISNIVLHPQVRINIV
jgi:hypothetical protein